METILHILSSHEALLVFLLLFVLVTACILRFCPRRIGRLYSLVCMCLYGFALAYITLLSRDPILETRLNLIPFQAGDGWMWFDAFANIALFIPFPILLYGIAPRKLHGCRLVCAGIGLSLFIEIIQYFTHRGICDIDDLILNSIGVIVGALISMIFAKTIKHE